MRSPVRKLGNSAGVIIPRSLLDDLGLAAGDRLDMRLENGGLVLTPVRSLPRSGWADASKAIAAADDDGLVWPEFANAGDDDLTW